MDGWMNPVSSDTFRPCCFPFQSKFCSPPHHWLIDREGPMWCREGLCCLWSIYLWALHCGAHENCWCVRGFVGFHGNREVAMFSILWLLVIEVLFNMFRIPGQWGLVCPRDMPTDPGSVWWNPCQEQGCFHRGIKKPLDQMFFLSSSLLHPSIQPFLGTCSVPTPGDTKRAHVLWGKLEKSIVAKRQAEFSDWGGLRVWRSEERALRHAESVHRLCWT